MLDLKSLPTKRPTMPERAMLRRNCSVALGEPSYESGITGPPWKPSSVISVQRTDGVHSDFSQARSTPGVRNNSSLILRSVSWYFGSKMSPSVFSTTMRSTLPRPRSSARLSR